MAIHNPPLYRYPLYEPWDREAFNYLRDIGKTGRYPAIIGTPAEKQRFLITLIRTQKSLTDWRDMPRDVLQAAKEHGQIDAGELNRKYPPESISQEVPEWVTYKEDETVSKFIDELAIKAVTFSGTDDEAAEFVCRFILGQLGNDWEQTILLIWEMLGDKNELILSRLNKELATFDYSHKFASA